jgi:DNA-binding XRE family transcriptional regulator
MDAKTEDHPKIKTVGVSAPLTLKVTWENGVVHDIYFQAFAEHHQALVPILASAELFAAVQVGDWGWCAHWTDDIEVSASALWGLALSQDGARFRSWRKHHRLTQNEVADALGISARMIKYYEAGQHAIPKTVKLAMRGFDADAA